MQQDLSGQILTSPARADTIARPSLNRNIQGLVAMAPDHEATPRPAYLLVTACVTDPAAMAAYAGALAASGLYARHGGHYLFLGKAAAPLEDWDPATSIVCAIFPSRSAAQAFWDDPQYQTAIKPLRADAGTFHVAIFDGL